MWLLFLWLLFVPASAAAQTEPVANGPFAPTTVYELPPASLELPRSWDLDSVRAARGNLARWRDSERQRLGAYDFDFRTGVARNALPEVGGYFAYFGDGQLPGGIVEARWRGAESRTGEAGPIWSRYTHDRRLCGGRVETGYADVSEMTYLGSNWLTDFDTLDSELGRASPGAAGRTLPEGVTLSFAQPPSPRDFSRFYPAPAYRASVSGYAELACYVRSDLGLYCATLSESPIGYDFGESSQRIMRGVRVASALSNGEPSPGYCLQRRVNFVMPN